MKKVLFFALLICTIFALTACDPNDFDYTVTDAGVIINKYTGDASEIEIPSTIGKKTITSIGDFAFADRSNLKNVIIPQSVTSIGRGAFYNCNNLLNVAIPHRATYEYSDVFEMCNVKNVFVYNVIDGEAIITDYIGNASEMKIPSVIGKYPVISIGEWAFCSCENLTSVAIPNSITSIEYGAFAFCNEDLVIYGEANSCADYYAQNNNIAFSYTFSKRYEDFEYVISGDKTVITGYNGTATEVEIPSAIEGYQVKSINNRAFYGCSNLTCVTIPLSVTSIGDYAFNSCSSLKNVIIPAGTNTGDHVFSGSSSQFVLLRYIVDNGEATIIGHGSVYGEVVIPSMIGEYPVTRIGEKAFQYSRATSVIIPDSVTSIGSFAFDNTQKLSSITIPGSVTRVEGYAFNRCSSITSVIIQDGVTSIGDGAFNCCSSLTRVTIPDSVTSIGEDAFFCCSSLTRVTIPDSVTSIGRSAFFGCSSLTIWGNADSYVQRYAKENKIRFQEIH